MIDLTLQVTINNEHGIWTLIHSFITLLINFFQLKFFWLEGLFFSTAESVSYLIESLK